jgi:hypothetical protein
VDRRLLAVVGFALLAGGVTLWLTRDPAAPTEPARPPAVAAVVEEPPPARPPARASTERVPPEPTEEVIRDTPVPALVRAGPQPGDDVEQRRRLEQQAALAAPYWARLAPRVQDPALREASTEMFARLNRLDAPAADLARAEYDLTQALIAKGGLDRKSKAWLDYLNSTSAAVIQDGDPTAIPTPEQAGLYRPGGR